MPTLLFGPPKKSDPDIGLAAGQASAGIGDAAPGTRIGGC
jgi:hypothetical protein